MTSKNTSRDNLPLTWREENTVTAKSLLDEHGEALALYVDNSYEALVMLHAFRDAGYIPRCFSLTETDSDDWQKQNGPILDIRAAHDFHLRVISLATDFWEHQAIDIASRYGVLSSQEVLRIHAASCAAGVPVLAGYLAPITKNDGWVITYKNENTVLEDIVSANEMSVIPSFLTRRSHQIISRAKCWAIAFGKYGTTAPYAAIQEFYPEIPEFSASKGMRASIFEKKMKSNLHYQLVNKKDRTIRLQDFS